MAYVLAMAFRLSVASTTCLSPPVTRAHNAPPGRANLSHRTLHLYRDRTRDPQSQPSPFVKDVFSSVTGRGCGRGR